MFNMPINVVVVGAGQMGQAFIDMAQKTPDFTVESVYDACPRAGVNDIAQLKNDLSSDKIPYYSMIVDFTVPDAFMKNIDTYLAANKSVIVGTTGWFANADKLKHVTDKVNEAGTGLIYSGNYSLGVQSIYTTLKTLTGCAEKIGGFDVSIIEEHHVRKADSPSGTAVEMGKIVINNLSSKTEMLIGNSDGKIKPSQLQISSLRLSNVYGTHTVVFEDDNQRIELKHVSKDRRHFAQGAVQAAKFIQGKAGVYNMTDLARELFQKA